MEYRIDAIEPIQVPIQKLTLNLTADDIKQVAWDLRKCEVGYYLANATKSLLAIFNQLEKGV